MSARLTSHNKLYDGTLSKEWGKLVFTGWKLHLRTPVNSLVSNCLTAHMLTKVSLGSFYLSGSSLTFPKAKKLSSFNLIRQTRDLTSADPGKIFTIGHYRYLWRLIIQQSCQIIPPRLLLPSNHALVISSFNSDYSEIIQSVDTLKLTSSIHTEIYAVFIFRWCHQSFSLDDRQLQSCSLGREVIKLWWQ